MQGLGFRGRDLGLGFRDYGLRFGVVQVGFRTLVWAQGLLFGVRVKGPQKL